MKIQRLIFLIFTTIVVFACVTDHPSPQVLKISENTLRFSGNGGVWKLTVNSNCEWKITGGDTWCTTDKMEGSKTAEILRGSSGVQRGGVHHSKRRKGGFRRTQRGRKIYARKMYYGGDYGLYR